MDDLQVEAITTTDSLADILTNRIQLDPNDRWLSLLSNFKVMALQCKTLLPHRTRFGILHTLCKEHLTLSTAA